jgi:hypothetical protein
MILEEDIEFASLKDDMLPMLYYIQTFIFICIKSILVIFCQYLIAKGTKINPAKKKRIKANVNGGISVRANLKIGEAIPQIMLVMIRARIGFIDKSQN